MTTAGSSTTSPGFAETALHQLGIATVGCDGYLVATIRNIEAQATSAEVLLPKQKVEGSRPFSRSTPLVWIRLAARWVVASFTRSPASCHRKGGPRQTCRSIPESELGVGRTGAVRAGAYAASHLIAQ